MFKFALLDPRPQGAAANETVFSSAPQGVLGIEVTVPALATRCTLGNIDPQHSGGDASRAAIEEALVCALPPDGATIATVRPDLDAIGAMAVLELRTSGVEFSPNAHRRTALVAESDTFAHGGWPGKRPLPSRTELWPAAASAEDIRELAAIAAAVMDFKVPITGRVTAMERWLLHGEDGALAEYRVQVNRARGEMVDALARGDIAIHEAAGGRIAVVVSTHRAGAAIGYYIAPVVVALNPKFRLGGGEPHAKFTVCQFTAGHIDLRAAVADLSAHEPGWGGSPTIVGSPQGVGSTLTTDEVIAVVVRHLLQ